MKRKALKLELGKKTVSSLKAIKKVNEIKGGVFTFPCATNADEYFCHPTDITDLC